MPDHTGNKPHTGKSIYLFNMEVLTDREIDAIYELSKELTLQLDRFKEFDAKYRALEEISTKESEKERSDLINSCVLISTKTTEALKEMTEISIRVTELLYKAKGALDEKIESEKE